MPPRPKDIPHNIERTALQKMTAGHWLPTADLYPASTVTIEGMLSKGWIDIQMADNGQVRYRITSAGEAALKAKIPMDR
jgi:hypothetical protein